MLGSRRRWGLGAFCCFLYVSGLVPQRSLLGDGPAGDTPRRAAVSREIGDAFGNFGALLARHELELRGRARRSGTPRLRSALSAWASELEAGSIDLEPARQEIFEALEEARQEAELDLLFLVTDDGGVFLPAVDVQPSDATLLLLGESAFSGGRSASGIEVLVAAPPVADGTPEFVGEATSALYLTAASPLPVAGSAPAACLIAAVPFSNVTAGADALLTDSTVKLRWHLYRRLGADEAVIQDGATRGEVLSRAFVDQVQSPGRDVNLVLESQLGLGLWEAFASISGKSPGGWGVTADPEFVAALLASESPPPAAVLRKNRQRPVASKVAATATALQSEASGLDEETIRLILYCVGATVVGGILWFSLTAWFSRRRRRALLDRMTASSAAENAPRTFPETPEPVADTLVAQFEINWKTFASYMQDLLQEKLKSLDKTPQETVDRLCDCVGELSENVSELRQDFAGTQTGIRGASTELVQRFSQAVEGMAAANPDGMPVNIAGGGLSPESEKAIGKILEELQETRVRFGVLDTALIQLAEVFGEGREDMVVARVSEERGVLEAEFATERQAFAANSKALNDELEQLRRTCQEQVSSLEKVAERESELKRLAERATQQDSQLERRLAELEETLREKDTLLEAAESRAGDLGKQLEASTRREEDGAAALHDVNARAAELERTAKGRAADREIQKQQMDELRASATELKARLVDSTAQVTDLESELAASRESERQAVEVAQEGDSESQRRAAELESAFERSVARVSELESDLAASRQREQSAAASLAEAEKGGSEIQGRLVGLESDLKASVARAAELETALAETRESVGRAEELSEAAVQRKAAEFEKERDVFAQRIAAAAAEAARQEDVAAASACEVERLRGLTETQVKALTQRDQSLAELRETSALLEKAVEREKQAMGVAKSEEARLLAEATTRDERLVALEDEVRSSGNELGRLRAAEQTRGEELARLEGEVGGLRGELEEARTQLESTRKRLDAQTAESERKDSERGSMASELEEALRQREGELREANDSRLQLKAQLAEAEATWHSKLADLELKVSDGERRSKSLSVKVSDAEHTVRQLSEELAGARKGGASTDLTGQTATLESEKAELSSSLKTVTEELEAARGEADQARRFQKALVNGSLGTAVVGLDSSLRVFSWNDDARDLWGPSVAEVMGKALGEVDMDGVDVAAAEKVAKGGKGVALERVTVRDSSGVDRQIEFRLDPIIALDDRGHGVVVIAEDVTQSVEYEIEAKVTGIFNESLVKSLPAALVVVDAQDRVIRWNRGAESVLGVAEDEAVGNSLFSLSTPLSKAPFKKKFAAGKKAGGSQKVKVKLDVAGVASQYLLTQCPFLGADDTVRGSVLLLQEIQVGVEV